MLKVTQLTPIVFSNEEPVVTIYKVTQLTPIFYKNKLISMCPKRNNINIESNQTDPDMFFNNIYIYIYIYIYLFVAILLKSIAFRC